MCGLAGLLAIDQQLDQQQIENLQAMGQALEHRGPDDEGLYVDPENRMALAFRRLSIIDLGGGHQPMSNEDKTIWVACNGEIYNFQQLRSELIDSGHQFSTNSDTEVIVHLYEQFGWQCLGKLGGMFALAIWDQQIGRLILAVDRAGKKPLYYTQAAGRFAFASELKSLERWDDFDGRLDHTSLLEYLAYGYIGPQRSIYKDLWKLPPGHFLSLSSQNGRWTVPTRYWQMPRTRFRGSYQDACVVLEEKLARAVRLRLISDVPLGVLLSGGLDSSIVTALTARASSKPVRTFSAGFEAEKYNELPLARIMAQHVGTDHTELMIKPPDAQQLLDIATGFDEPFADSSAIPTYLICQLTRQHVTVTLAGDGGDELFGGYRRHRAARVLRRVRQVAGGSLLGQIDKLLPASEYRSAASYLKRFALASKARTLGSAYSSLVGVFQQPALGAILGPALQESAANYRDQIAILFDSHTFSSDPAGMAMWADFNNYLPGDLLVKIDRASMANALECRSPLLDTDVTEFAFSLPARWRAGLLTGKKILRDTFGKLLPSEVLKAPKRGFGVPIGSWLRGPMQNLLHELLDKPQAVQSELLDGGAVQQLIDQHLAGRADNGHQLWSLLVLEMFLRRKPIAAGR